MSGIHENALENVQVQILIETKAVKVTKNLNKYTGTWQKCVVSLLNPNSIRSVDPDPGNSPTRKKWRNIMFWRAACSHWKAGGFACSRIHRSCTGVKASFQVGVKVGIKRGMTHIPPVCNPTLKLTLTLVQDLWIRLLEHTFFTEV